ncbi:glycosyltransferase family 9 protein [Candidatus Woesearchaeota archaeon]|nr:glycosyltransferase family 9 protein [Candidatus Woesearchaeota archaeon]
MKEELNPKKILVFKIGAIGDILMTTPLVRQIRKSFPKADIVYYVGKYAADIFQGNKYLNRVESFDQNIFYKKNILRAISLRNKIKKEKFDIAFVLDKHWSFGLFAKLCGIPIRVGFKRDLRDYLTHKIVYRQVKHEIHYYLSLLEAIELKPNYSDTNLDLTLSKKDLAFAENFFKSNKIKKAIGIAAGGGKNPGEKEPIRRFPIEKMIELIKNLSTDNKIILLGGSSDDELNKGIISFIKSENIINGTNPDIKKSAALMKKCSAMVCGDSGPMHIASAVNDKIISLFGPTNPKRKAPLHKKSVAIWHDQDIYEEDYELYGKIPDSSKRDKWMRKITVNEVEGAVENILR